MEENQIKEKCEALGITRISLRSPLYPPLLKEIVNPPEVLYAKGRLELLQGPMMAVVGARKATVYGLDASAAVAGRLVENGFTVISGMALGVDSAAHEAALGAGGDTVAVLGSGVDVCYPYARHSLYQEILSKGLIISPFAPGEDPLSWHFPVRNRIISGASLGVVVVEAGIKSGSLSTAESALDAGREVYCVPGSIFLEHNQGANRLLNDGAQLVGCLDDLPGARSIAPGTLADQKPKTVLPLALSETEAALLALVSDFGSTPDELAQKTHLNVSQINACISSLRLKGLVRTDAHCTIYKTR